MREGPPRAALSISAFEARREEAFSFNDILGRTFEMNDLEKLSVFLKKRMHRSSTEVKKRERLRYLERLEILLHAKSQLGRTFEMNDLERLRIF